MNLNDLHITAHQVSQQTSEEIKNGFAVRTKLLNRTLQKLKKINRTDAIQHLVYVGARGSGKSTILNRIKVEFDESEKFIAIYLPEEQPGLYRLFDLWLAVIEELQSMGYQLEKPIVHDYNEDLSYLSKDAYVVIQKLLKAEDKQLILLIDNIDRVFKNIDEEKALLRELLMNHKDLIIIGGSTEMSEDFWDYKDPFYQFFKIERLEGLSATEVQELLRFWSKINNVKEIEQVLKENPGKIEAIRQMTGGNPRTMILFINMLVNHTEAKGFDYLKRIIDKTTPIYQERLQQVSPQQRKILAELSFLWKPSSVDELVPRCLMPSKQISAQLSKMEKARIIESTKIPKSKTKYRLKERLFNLYMIMTQAGSLQKKRARYLTDFLELWYDKEHIQDYYQQTLCNLESNKQAPHELVRIKALVHSKDISLKQRDYLLEKAAEIACWSNSDKSILPELSSKTLDKAEKAFEEGKYELAKTLLEEIEQKDGDIYYNLGLVYQNLNNPKNAKANYLKAINFENVSAMNNYAMYISEQNQFDEAAKYFKMAINKGHVLSIHNYAYILSEQDQFDEAAKYYIMAIDKGDVSAMNNYAIKLSERDQFDKAANYFKMAIDNGEVSAMNNYAIDLSEQGKFIEATKYFKMAIDKGNVVAMYNYAYTLSEQDQFDEAAKYYIMAIDKGDVSSMYNYANQLSEQNQFDEAAKYYVMAIDKGHVNSMINYALNLYSENKHEDAYRYFVIASKQKESTFLNSALLFFHSINNAAYAKRLIKDSDDITIDKSTKNLIDLWLGNITNYEANRNQVLKEVKEREDLINYLTINLIHQQTSWVIQVLEEEEDLRLKNEPIFYASKLLQNQKSGQNYDIPETMHEIVAEIVSTVEEKRKLYYS